MRWEIYAEIGPDVRLFRSKAVKYMKKILTMSYELQIAITVYRWNSMCRAPGRKMWPASESLKGSCAWSIIKITTLWKSHWQQEAMFPGNWFHKRDLEHTPKYLPDTMFVKRCYWVSFTALQGWEIKAHKRLYSCLRLACWSRRSGIWTLVLKLC